MVHGRPLQTCDKLVWDFGDSTSLTTNGNAPATHRFVPTSWFALDRSFLIYVTISNDLGSVKGGVTNGIHFPAPPCTYGRTFDAQTFAPTFHGPKSGCVPGAGKCAIGEQIAFSTSISPAAAESCDAWSVVWGDGTNGQNIYIGDPSAIASAQHYFSTIGSFNVTFQLVDGANPPSQKSSLSAGTATLTVVVTEHGEAPPPRRRSAHH